MSKIRDVTELYSETLKEITSDNDSWLSFLDTSSSNYKYSFQDQVLIYAQRPDAKACAEIETWNKVLKRWVNKGAKGIALLTEKDGNPYLRYVFDVSDTNSRYGNKVNLWYISKKYEDSIIESLENIYGDLSNKDSLANTIKSAIDNMVSDNLQDYFDELKNNTIGSNLEDLSNDNLKERFTNILSNSVTYQVLKRAGLNPNDYLNKDVFKDIRLFNSYGSITTLGIASSDLSENMLREIANKIRDLLINEKKSKSHIC